MKLTTLKTTVAALALTAGTAFAADNATGSASADVSADTGAVSADATRDADVNAETGSMTDTADTAGETLKKTGEAAVDTAEDVADATADAASDAAEATAETASDAADAAEETAEDATEAAGDAVEDTAADVDATVDSQADIATSTADAGMAFSGMVAGDLIGMEVIEANGETVGEIDYVVRQADGLAAVIGIGGFLGLGEYTVAVPLDEFSRSPEGELKLNTWTEAELEAQPEFDETGVESLPEDAPLDEMS